MQWRCGCEGYWCTPSVLSYCLHASHYMPLLTTCLSSPIRTTCLYELYTCLSSPIQNYLYQLLCWLLILCLLSHLLYMVISPTYLYLAGLIMVGLLCLHLVASAMSTVHQLQLLCRHWARSHYVSHTSHLELCVHELAIPVKKVYAFGGIDQDGSVWCTCTIFLGYHALWGPRPVTWGQRSSLMLTRVLFNFLAQQRPRK